MMLGSKFSIPMSQRRKKLNDAIYTTGIIIMTRFGFVFASIKSSGRTQSQSIGPLQEKDQIEMIAVKEQR